MPEPPDGASFEVKDKACRSRIISIIAFVLLIVGVIYGPPVIYGLLTGRSLVSTIGALTVYPVVLILIVLNRSRQVLAASLIVVVVAELSFTSGFLGSLPLGEANLRLCSTNKNRP